MVAMDMYLTHYRLDIPAPFTQLSVHPSGAMSDQGVGGYRSDGEGLLDWLVDLGGRLAGMTSD
jgi:hypothetical protein